MSSPIGAQLRRYVPIEMHITSIISASQKAQWRGTGVTEFINEYAIAQDDHHLGIALQDIVCYIIIRNQWFSTACLITYRNLTDLAQITKYNIMGSPFP